MEGEIDKQTKDFQYQENICVQSMLGQCRKRQSLLTRKGNSEKEDR